MSIFLRASPKTKKDQDLETQARKIAAFRLAKEMEIMAEQLMNQAITLQEEINHGK